MYLFCFPSGPFETNAYAVGCPRTSHAAIIDPAPGSLDPILQCIEENQLLPQAILLTHSHWDHIADAAALKDYYKIPILVHALDAQNLREPGSDRLPCWIEIRGTEPSQLFEEGSSFILGELEFIVIHTPGHTPGGVCLYLAKEGVLFSGDTLFKGTIGNISFPTAQPDLMWSSLDKLAKIPPETKVYPGHGPSTKIGDERWLPKARELFGED